MFNWLEQYEVSKRVRQAFKLLAAFLALPVPKMGMP